MAELNSAFAVRETSHPAFSLPKIISAIASRAAAYDAEGVFPGRDIEELRNAGLLNAFSRPHEHDARALTDTLRGIGRANLSVGRIFEGHVNGTKLVAWYGTAAQRRRLQSGLDAGRLFAVWATEPAVGVRLQVQDGGWRLEGMKTFATGAGHVDSALITATLPNGRKQLLWMRLRGETGRDDASVWRVRGMRATISGTYDFTGMTVQNDDLIGNPGDYEAEPRFTAGAWRFTAVQLGGIETLVILLREHLRKSGGEKDPVHRGRFGQAVVAARNAALWVEKAAALAEALSPDSIAVALMARGVVEDAGHLVMEAVARTIGTRAFFTDHPADRIARDLGLYLRQAMPDQARDRAAVAWLESDPWEGDPLW